MNDELLVRLPHKPPFRFVDSVNAIDDDTVEARWEVCGDEPFFSGHFPGEPIVPGVLITEALAQACGLLLVRDAASHTDAHRGLLVQTEIRFRHPVRPPASIVLRAVRDGGLGRLHRFEVLARIANDTIAEGTIVLMLADDGLPRVPPA
ncbi:MAG: 3-hydroxyacyl-[acyl-carrier-protein] dehydratase FabZ [Phycisphaerae bacterium]|nr:3-hydroxyacyl-[acyl-carrier-protein] dehydratase FabZ [Phycisphaerae bacterium]